MVVLTTLQTYSNTIRRHLYRGLRYRRVCIHPDKGGEKNKARGPSTDKDRYVEGNNGDK